MAEPIRVKRSVAARMVRVDCAMCCAGAPSMTRASGVRMVTERPLESQCASMRGGGVDGQGRRSGHDGFDGGVGGVIGEDVFEGEERGEEGGHHDQATGDGGEGGGVGAEAERKRTIIRMKRVRGCRQSALLERKRLRSRERVAVKTGMSPLSPAGRGLGEGAALRFVRWPPHPGPLPPGRGSSKGEGGGWIPQVGVWVADEGCAAVAAMFAEGAARIMSAAFEVEGAFGFVEEPEFFGLREKDGRGRRVVSGRWTRLRRGGWQGARFRIVAGRG